MLLQEYQGKSLPFQWKGETRQVPFLTRVDPLSGNVCKISEERARRGVGICANLDIRVVERCSFCHYQDATPGARIEHDCGAVTVPNLYPWEKYDWITIYPPFGQHKLLLSDLWFDDLERMLESSFELAQICARDEEVIGFMDFTNWGPFAGASQQHPHSQRRSITTTLDPQQERELDQCHSLAGRYVRNPFDLLAEEERKDGRRVIYDNDIFIAAAFAPTTGNEIIAFPKEPLAHILQSSQEDRQRILRPLLGIFPALFFYAGVTDLNIAVHMAPFAVMEEARKYYRWHLHIYPRRPRLPVDRAGAEMGFDTDVVDVLPENCAQTLRRWYQNGPQKEFLVKMEDGTPSPALEDLFRRAVPGCPS